MTDGTCTFCHGPLGREHYQLVEGWERKGSGESRRSGSDIVARRKQERFACRWCVDKLRKGLSVEQQTLVG